MVLVNLVTLCLQRGRCRNEFKFLQTVATYRYFKSNYESPLLLSLGTLRHCVDDDEHMALVSKMVIGNISFTRSIHCCHSFIHSLL